jgi:glucans biosynthesis protein
MNSICPGALTGFIFSFFLWSCPVLAFEGEFSFQRVVDQAKSLAAHPFQEVSDNKIPDFLKNISYDQWRDIRFKDPHTLWQNEREPFKIRFFHLGFYYHQPVVINYVDSTGTHPFLFSPDIFDYGKNDFQGKIPSDLGFAGFRIHYPINTSSYDDEIAVFLGATYFRAVAKGQLYGMSARGLAVNTAVNGGEEFPFFREFWIIKPHQYDKEITVYALLDSPSVTGAYEFIIHPAKETAMQVSSTLFIRKKIQKLGIAPMTSMFLYGENSKIDGNDDFRPQVHDSDGLLVFTRSGEWVWRPLVNPKQLLVNTFEVDTPQGFGLFQRDMNFDHYQDLESRFDLRPSLWVVPKGEWGKGHVELIQIPSDSERNDNIDALWVPAKPTEAGGELKFSYILQWRSARDKGTSEGYVTDTYVMRGAQGAKFIIDFQGKEINDMPAGKNLTADLSVTKGYRVTEQQVFKNTVTGGWRLVFQINFDKQGLLKDAVPAQRPAAGLRAFLKNGPDTLTETWDYAFTP